MANEGTIRVSARIRKRSGSTVLLDERFDVSARFDVDGTVGPTPGSIAVPQTGVSVDLSQLSTPGACGLKNQGAVPVDWGIMDPESGRFYALGRLQPGRGAWLDSLYPFFGEFEIEGTGTGSFSSTYYLHLKAIGAAGQVFVGAYEA